MGKCKESRAGCCCFHPKEVVVGVCAPCLKERLLQVLASEEGRRRRRLLCHPPAKEESKRSPLLVLLKEKAVVTLPKIFALGSFVHMADSHHAGESKGQVSKDEDSIFSSLEDSFISIKLEANREASGDVHRSKEAGVLRWRKRIGKLLRLGQSRWSSKARACHVGGYEGKKEEAKARGQQRR